MLLANALAGSGDLFRRPGTDGGLLLVLPNGEFKNIATGAHLAPVVSDRVELRRFHNGKSKASRLPATTLTEMLHSETFLSCFQPVDRVTSVPEYLPDFSLSRPGYNDGGEGHRCYYVGNYPTISWVPERMAAFLREMDFESVADQANAIAGLLTVMLRQHWPGGKPIIVATATKSHSGKDTVLDFIAGQTPKTSVSWERQDWATQKAIVVTLNTDPTIGVARLENARVQGDAPIASAFVERFVTDPAPMLYSPGCGSSPRKIRNEIVMAISTNFGSLSEDLLNRSLPIHLAPQGSVRDRNSKIGNPRTEYLPRYREEIAAEAHGMIARWRAVGMPLDTSKRHPFTPWAHTIGGILKVNGVEGFLENYLHRLISDDPIRNAIAVLGVEVPDQWLTVDHLADRVVTLGLVDPLVPKNERSNHEAIKRGLGKVLSQHEDEQFIGKSETERFKLRLEKARRRFESANPHTRYRFNVIERTERGTEDEPEDVVATNPEFPRIQS